MSKKEFLAHLAIGIIVLFVYEKLIRDRGESA